YCNPAFATLGDRLLQVDELDRGIETAMGDPEIQTALAASDAAITSSSLRLRLRQSTSEIIERTSAAQNALHDAQLSVLRIEEAIALRSPSPRIWGRVMAASFAAALGAFGATVQDSDVRLAVESALSLIRQLLIDGTLPSVSQLTLPVAGWLVGASVVISAV